MDTSSFFLLPKLKFDDTDIKPGSAGEWNLQHSTAFQDVASSLEVASPGRDSTVSSIPDMWARPLSMEMALYNDKYPLRIRMIEEWQGMLAALALAEVRNFNIKAELIELGNLKGRDTFARSLYELLPSPNNSLYSLSDGKHPWEDVYVLLWNGTPVGMTSPSTIICPSEEANWDTLDWFKGGRLRSPVQPVDYLNVDEKTQLWLWLQNIREQLYQYDADQNSINVASKHLTDFQNSLRVTPDQSPKRSIKTHFFGEEFNRGVLKALNFPIQAFPKPSSVRLIPSEGKTPLRELIIIPDPYKIISAWGQPAQDIWIYESTNLASFKFNQLPTWDVDSLKEQDVFLQSLFFIEQENALPGGLLPRMATSLKHNEQPITPLMPINPRLLEYLTPEDLIGKISFEQKNTNTGPQVRVFLDLPLSGLNNGTPPKNYRIFKDYPLNEANALTDLPVIEVWPNFKAANWREYYAFYYSSKLEDGAFQITWSGARDTYSFKGVGSISVFNRPDFPDTGNYQITNLEEFPSFITCQDKSKNLLGLILLKPPREVGTTNATTWKVGVDFGTSFTNVYVNKGGIVERLNLEPLHFKVTESSREVRSRVLYEYFIADNMVLPISSVLTTRGNKENNRPIFDGRIYIPRDSVTFKPNLDNWIKTNLKWETDLLPWNRLFIRHLALQITAQAVESSVKTIQWAVSYPSAFSPNDKRGYAKTWGDITKELQQTTGIIHNSPTKEKNFNFYRTESLAVAQYYAHFILPGIKEKLNLINSTCIDMGGGTSDISIWEEKKLVHQCSVQLAGRDLFSQFIEKNPGFLERQFRVNLADWSALHGPPFYAKLDVLLRREGDDWLKNRRDDVADDPEFQGLTQLIAIATVGLYYYVGILLQVLHEEGKYTRNEITPVYVGGNGSRFLNWLAEGGEFDDSSEINDILSRILSLGSGFKDTQENTELNPRPKDEVACGLVLYDSQLEDLDSEEEDLLIVGESCEINGKPLDWKCRLQLEQRIDDFAVPKLVQLPKFLNSFHETLRKLKIQSIKPLEGYKISENIEEDNSKLWRDTAKELRTSLINMKGKSSNEIRPEPPFILALKALLTVLGNRWAEKWKRTN